MAYTTINKQTDYFNTKLYTGTGYSLNVTGVGHQPDFTWIKCSAAGSGTDHVLFDTVRGVTKALNSNDNSVEDPISNALTAFGTDGFTVNGNGATGANGDTYVSWNWKAGTTSGLSGGTITPSSYSINTTSGFGIYTYTGTGSAGTIAHGLGSTPKMIIVKCTSNADTWAVYHADVGATKYMELDTTAAAQTSTQPWNDTEPTSSVFTVGNWSATNGSGRTYVAYCFAGKTGYSKFGSFVGNGSSDGVFCYTGMKPAWVLIKQINTTNNWLLFDNKRPGYNLTANFLEPDAYGAEAVNNPNNRIDILSNGFKIRGSGTATNASGGTYIYMTFGQSIVGTNNIPATAR